MKRKQRPNVSLLLWLTKEFIILSILSNLVCTALYMAASWLLTGTPIPASHSSGLGPLLFLIGSTVILGCGLNYRFNQFLTGLAGGLRGVAEGNFSLRLDPRRAGPLAAAYEDFNKMAEELQGVQTLREDFINSFSHEFKTPITAVSGFAELLQGARPHRGGAQPVPPDHRRGGPPLGQPGQQHPADVPVGVPALHPGEGALPPG
ncbi:MAG: histidine kinase dimerization/phospho-acceptor domain-containing protein [Lawsonibacter sp.]